MILAKLAELAMCRISGEEEVKKTRGAPAPGAPLFPTPVSGRAERKLRTIGRSHISSMGTPSRNLASLGIIIYTWYLVPYCLTVLLTLESRIDQ